MGIIAAVANFGISSILLKAELGAVKSLGVSQARLTEYAKGLSADRPYVISGVKDAKTGKTYFGGNKGITKMEDVHPELAKRMPKESLEKWSVFNCAECDAFNNALKAGAKWEDLKDLHTRRWDNNTRSYIDF